MLINVFDVRQIADHTARTLKHAGHTVNIHSPMYRKNEDGREYHHPRTMVYPGESTATAPAIESELTAALQQNRALWLVTSVSASVVGNAMLDLCGNSGNIIFCAPPIYGQNKILGSTLTVTRIRSAQQIARIRGNDVGKQYRELEAADELIHLCRLALADSMFRDNARIRFREAIKGGAYLASSTLVAYAEFFGFTSPERPNYVELIEEHVAKRGA